jgi:hypothetical protein
MHLLATIFEKSKRNLNDVCCSQFSQETSKILDVIDKFRASEETRLAAISAGTYSPPESTINTEFEGHGVLIVAQDTVDSTPLCLGLGPSGYQVCFLSDSSMQL